MRRTYEELTVLLDKKVLELSDHVCRMDLAELREIYNDVYNTDPGPHLVASKVVQEVLTICLHAALED